MTALQADNQHTAHSLTVRWERPAGLYDGYRLQLLDRAGAVLANRSLPADSRGERLEALTPGRWYRVRVVTLSGGVASAEAAAEGQTRECPALPAAARPGTQESRLFPVRRPGGRHQPDLGVGQPLRARLLVAALGRPRGRLRGVAPQRPRGSRSRRRPPGGLILPAPHSFSGALASHAWLACPQAGGGLVDLQKLPAAADGCAFGGLRAGSLYRLQVVSWSRDMSSDSATLARTGQSTRTAPWWASKETTPTAALSQGHMTSRPRVRFRLADVIFFPVSALCSVVSGGRELGTHGHTDSQLAPWRRQPGRLSGDRRPPTIIVRLSGRGQRLLLPSGAVVRRFWSDCGSADGGRRPHQSRVLRAAPWSAVPRRGHHTQRGTDQSRVSDGTHR